MLHENRIDVDVPVVLLPGTLCNARVFAPLLGHLPPRTAIVPDIRGAVTTPDMAQRLLEELPERFALAGFSLGGIIALEMIARQPHRIAGLCLLGTTARPDPVANAAARRAALARARETGAGAHVGAAFWPSYVSPGAIGNAALKALVVQMADETGLDAFADQTEIVMHRADSRPRLGWITVPALVLCGEDDRLCPPGIQSEMAALIPGAHLAIIPSAGHFAVIEQPEAVAAHVGAWLDRLGPASAEAMTTAVRAAETTASLPRSKPS